MSQYLNSNGHPILAGHRIIERTTTEKITEVQPLGSAELEDAIKLGQARVDQEIKRETARSAQQLNWFKRITKVLKGLVPMQF